MAIRQRQQKLERRIKRAEKTLAEARWDNESKMWRRGIVDGLKLFPAITQEDETQGKKATCKTDKGSNKPKETQRSWLGEDDSDDEEFLNQLLHDRPPPYAINDTAPSTRTRHRVRKLQIQYRQVIRFDTEWCQYTQCTRRADKVATSTTDTEDLPRRPSTRDKHESNGAA
ncbi:hypothetical protein NDU88_001722 [Pleurodeles waltl]|uniref:Uncharacterized protein n=1 Tax=Pleurodeles waltl TaxID=8319 RepID=A0AAV7VX83_PLEWA|nr:hypothetical protein NDU88_001722 [Pleurodeles waltl]